MGIFSYVAVSYTILFFYDVVRDMTSDVSCVRIAYFKIMVLFWLSMLF